MRCNWGITMCCSWISWKSNFYHFVGGNRAWIMWFHPDYYPVTGRVIRKNNKMPMYLWTDKPQLIFWGVMYSNTTVIQICKRQLACMDAWKSVYLTRKAWHKYYYLIKDFWALAPYFSDKIRSPLNTDNWITNPRYIMKPDDFRNSSKQLMISIFFI